MAESKVDNVEEDQASITYVENKGDIVNAYITFIKISMTQLKKWNNQGLLQCLIYLIKYHTQKNTKTTELIITEDILNVSVLIGLDSILVSIIPEQKCIPRKNNIKETPDVSILIKYTIKETVTTGKISQEDSLMHSKN